MSTTNFYKKKNHKSSTGTNVNEYAGNKTDIVNGDMTDTVTGAISLAPAGAFDIQAAGDVTIDSSAGDVKIATDANEQDVAIGNTQVGSGVSIVANDTLSLNNTNTTNGVAIGTSISGMPISIGHSTSETVVGDNLTVNGNLVVSGDTTVLDVANTRTQDPLIELAKDNATDVLDTGLIMTRASDNIGVIWDRSNSEVAHITTADDATTSGDVTIIDYADTHVGALTADDAINNQSVALATGWADDAVIALSFDDAGPRELTVTPTGTANYSISGERYSIATPKTLTISDVTGLHYVHIDSSGVLQDLTSFDTELIDGGKCFTAVIYWNATAGASVFTSYEAHSEKRNKLWHREHHNTEGTQYASGGALTGYTLSDNSTDDVVKFDMGDVVIYDEDIKIQIVDGVATTQFAQVLTGNAEIPVIYRDGVGGAWIQDAPTEFAFKNTGAGRVNYNLDTAGTWSQQEVTDNRWTSVYLIATPDYLYPIKSVQGQAEYASLNDAIDGLTDELASFANLNMEEFTILYRVILRTKDTYANTRLVQIDSIQDVRNENLNAVSASSGSHASLGDLSYDASGHTGFQRQTTSAASAPTANHDSVPTTGSVVYREGDLWTDTSTDITYVCQDATATAAVWQRLVTSTYTGAQTIQSTGQLTIKGTNNAADSLLLEADGGASETIRIRAVNSTASNAVNITSSGGVTLNGSGGVFINNTPMIIYDTSNPKIELDRALDGLYKTTIEEPDNVNFSITKNGETTSTISLHPTTASGTDECTVGEFRDTNTSNEVRNIMYRGNNTTGYNHYHICQGSSTSRVPTYIIKNDQDSNADGERETNIEFRGDKADATQTTLGQIEASHDGAADDYKSKVVFYSNDDGGANTLVSKLQLDADGVTVTSNDLIVSGNENSIKLVDTSATNAALTRTMGGYESMSGVTGQDQYFPPLKFMSTDSSLTSENPKLVACVTAKATEFFSGDADGGAAIEIFATDNNPGATSVPSRCATFQPGGSTIDTAVTIDNNLTVNTGNTVDFIGASWRGIPWRSPVFYCTDVLNAMTTSAIITGVSVNGGEVTSNQPKVWSPETDVMLERIIVNINHQRDINGVGEAFTMYGYLSEFDQVSGTGVDQANAYHRVHADFCTSGLLATLTAGTSPVYQPVLLGTNGDAIKTKSTANTAYTLGTKGTNEYSLIFTLGTPKQLYSSYAYMFAIGHSAVTSAVTQFGVSFQGYYTE